MPFSFKLARVFLNVSFIINTEVDTETKNSQSKFSPKPHPLKNSHDLAAAVHRTSQKFTSL